jgi:tetratricopeptide (TPR) repeat protein
VQDDIAQSVVKELRSALLGDKAAALANATVKEEVQAASRGRGDNVEAYRSYLQGRFFEDRFTQESSARALEYYRRALEIDPAYGLACAGVARVYCDQAGAFWLPIAEGFSKAREAAQRALELDPDLPEAHAAMGGIRIFYDWNWRGADESLRRALELAPGNARILRSAAIVARSPGRLQEAIELLRRAAALDPLGVPVHRTLAQACHAAGLLDEAEAAATKALEINPHDARSRFWLGLTLLARGRLDEAQTAFEHELHDDLLGLLGLALVHHASGRDADSRAALQALVEKDPDGGAYQIAEGYAGRGETDLCFEWLDRAYRQHDPGLASVKLDPLLYNVRGNPRWQPFLQKMKLAD